MARDCFDNKHSSLRVRFGGRREKHEGWRRGRTEGNI